MKTVKLTGVSPTKLSTFLARFTKLDLHTPLFIQGDTISCHASNSVKTIIASITESGLWTKNSAGDTTILVCTNTALLKKINKALATFSNTGTDSINITIAVEEYQGDIIGTRITMTGDKFTTKVSSIEYEFINKIPTTTLDSIVVPESGTPIAEFPITAEMLYIMDRLSNKKDDDYSLSFSISKRDDTTIVLSSVGSEDWEVVGKYSRFDSNDQYITGLLFTKILPKGIDYSAEIVLNERGGIVLVLRAESSTYIAPLVLND